jgi:hypothetical protein
LSGRPTVVQPTEAALHAALLKVLDLYEVAPSALLSILKHVSAPPVYWVIPAHQEKARVGEALTAFFKRPFEPTQGAWSLSLGEANQALGEIGSGRRTTPKRPRDR